MKNKKYLWFIVTAVALGSAISACGTPATPTPVPETPTPAASPTPSASDHIDTGVEYAEQGQLDEAIAEYQEAIKLEPDNADAHRNLGTAYGEQGEWEEAAAAYEQAIELAPDSGEAYGDLVGVYTYLERLPEAVAAGEKAIELAPDYATAHNNLGFAYSEQGKVDEAIAEYEEAIRLDPTDPTPHYNLGLLYRRQDQLDEAVAEYQEAIRLDPNRTDAHNNLGIAYYEQGKFDEAIAEWEKTIQINPDHANAHKNLGIAYADQGRVEEAIAELETYLQLWPDAPDRETMESKIAELEGPAPGEGAEYRNATGGYSLLYPEGWYYTEDETTVIFAESEEASEAALGEAPMIMFIVGPLSEIAESLGLEEITDPVAALEAMAENLEAEMGEIETGTIDSYPAALTEMSGTQEGTPYRGAIAVVLVEERAVYGVALAPPDQWDAFRPTFIAMINSLLFFEPQE